MPTISEDSISQRSSQFSGEDANFEQLMVSMLDERDKLMDSLRETQERLGETEVKLQEVEKERDSLQRQIAANLPQVCYNLRFLHDLPCVTPAGKCEYWALVSLVTAERLVETAVRDNTRVYHPHPHIGALSLYCPTTSLYLINFVKNQLAL